MRGITKFAVFVFIIISNSCIAQENSMSFDEIVYDAYTRGSVISVKVNREQAFFKNNNDERKVKLSKVAKEKLSELIKGLKLSELESYKSSSDDRTSDRSMHAELTIKVGEQVYKSSTFDASNPPVEFKGIIKKMFDLGKTDK